MGAGTRRLRQGETWTLHIDFTPPAPLPGQAGVVDDLTNGIELSLQGLVAALSQPTGAVDAPAVQKSGLVAMPQGSTTVVNTLIVTVAGPVETDDANVFNASLNGYLRAVQSTDGGASTGLTAKVVKNIDPSGVDQGPAPDDA